MSPMLSPDSLSSRHGRRFHLLGALTGQDLNRALLATADAGVDVSIPALRERAEHVLPGIKAARETSTS